MMPKKWNEAHTRYRCVGKTRINVLLTAFCNSGTTGKEPGGSEPISARLQQKFPLRYGISRKRDIDRRQQV